MDTTGLDPDIAAFLARFDSIMPPDFYDRPVPEQRRLYRDACLAMPSVDPGTVTVTDDAIDGPAGPIALRIYRPRGAETPGCLLYLHGGGFVLGDLDTHHALCLEIAAAAGTAVVQPAYRLAPEHPFPAAMEDIHTAALAAPALGRRHGFDGTRLGAAGDSCGGTFSAALAMMLRDRGEAPLSGQFLINPILDLRRWAAMQDDEIAQHHEAEFRAFTRAYLGPGRALSVDPLASPLFAADFSRLPPAFVLAAAVDPLNQDAILYARFLREAGVPVTLSIEPGTVHGYLRARHSSPLAARAFAALTGAVAERMSPAAARAAE